MRSSKNFVNSAHTIHSKHQQQRALHFESSNYKNKDLFKTTTRNHQPVLNTLPENCLILPASKHPFSVNKNVVRKLFARQDLYFKVMMFYEDLDNQIIYCSGNVLKKKTTLVNGRRTYIQRNDTLYELENCYSVEVFIKLSDLLHSNDFVFFDNNSLFLLNWI